MSGATSSIKTIFQNQIEAMARVLDQIVVRKLRVGAANMSDILWRGNLLYQVEEKGQSISKSKIILMSTGNKIY